jgi:signal transduction histidine kinase
VQARTNDVVSQAVRLRELSVRLMTTQDEERRRIAREMHDSAGQTIAALSMTVSQMSRELGDNNPRLSELGKDAQTMLSELGQEIRTTSYLLHPPMLDEFGLRVALAWYVEGLQQRSGMDVQLFVGELKRMPNEVELTIFRVVQECLTNIHRHSGSKSAHINIDSDPVNVVIRVRDFGRGMSEENLDTIRNRGAGVGLRGMRERVRPFAGDVQIDSQTGVGTTITVTIPYALPA